MTLLSRGTALQIIEKERRYQIQHFPPEQIRDSGLTRAQRDSEVVPHILMLEEYVSKARAAWVAGGDSFNAIRQIAKVGAIAVRALESVPVANRLVIEGLR